MNKRLVSLFFIVILALSGCSTATDFSSENMLTPSIITTEEVSLESSAAEGLLGEYMTNPVLWAEPVQEYGENAGYIRMEEDLVVRIAYPEGSLTVLNQAIEDWIAETVTEYQKEAAGSSKYGSSAELTADYNSYLQEDRWVSVQITGVFDKPYLAHPIDIMATFHADLKTGSLIALDDLLLPGGREKLQNIVIDDCNLEKEYIDEHLLDLWTLTPDGLEIILARGVYLPMSDGTIVLNYPYEMLKDILVMEDPIPSKEPSIEIDRETEEAIPPEESPIIPPVTIDPDKPMVALSFDDGPSKHTERLLDAFASHGGKGTFFVIGNIIEKRPEVLKRIVSEGHQIAGHSWDHRQLTKINSEEVTQEIMTTRAKIYEITGIDSTIIRPPYGSYDEEVKSVCAQLGIVMVNWSLDTLDWKHQDADKIYDAIMNDVKDGDIILCHDLYGTTVDAMERVIPALIEEGYQLVTVSELLSYSEKEVSPGNVYKKR